MTDPPILEVENVAKRFGGVRAVDGASFALARGSITALIGPNGAGKSSLFNVVTGFERPDGGSVRYDGRSIYRLPPHAIARRGMVRTFQLTSISGKRKLGTWMPCSLSQFPSRNESLNQSLL